MLNNCNKMKPVETTVWLFSGEYRNKPAYLPQNSQIAKTSVSFKKLTEKNLPKMNNHVVAQIVTPTPDARAPGRLRIAVLVDRFGRKFGGAEAYSVNVVESLSAAYDITVIAHEFEHDLPVREVQVKRKLFWPNWYRIWNFSRQAQQLTREGYDIVHSHMDGPSGDIQTMHVSPYKFRHVVTKPWWRRAFSYLSLRKLAYLYLEASRLRNQPGRHIVAVSPTTRDQLRRAYGSELTIGVITPGVHIVARNPELRLQARRELGWSNEDIGYVLIARNPLRKGLVSALQALRLQPSNHHLVVVGADEAARHEIAAHYADLRSRVRLIAPTPEVSRYLQASDVCVHPTMNDSFGMAPLEAMAHGLPVVISSAKYCGFTQYLTHGHNAWVLDNPRDHTALGQAMQTLAASPRLREGLTQKGLQLAESFSWAQVTARYEGLYSSCVAEKRWADKQGPIEPASDFYIDRTESV